MFKEKSYPFTKEGFELAKMGWFQKSIKKTITKTIIATISVVSIRVEDMVMANDLDSAGWQFVGYARKGLFWICLFTSFYGLYVMVMKKDGTGKKIIVTSIGVYIGSWMLPELFLLIQNTFSK
jgi:predicted ATP-grasp superfamily ATP-dependent carboligase